MKKNDMGIHRGRVDVLWMEVYGANNLWISLVLSPKWKNKGMNGHGDD